jgi:hypothetical protein
VRQKEKEADAGTRLWSRTRLFTVKTATGFPFLPQEGQIPGLLVGREQLPSFVVSQQSDIIYFFTEEG